MTTGPCPRPRGGGGGRRGHRLRLLRPRDNEALIDEQAFAHDEYLPYWAELWPSALALAEALAVARPARVLELGCGLAVPSLVAALGGAEVVATDWSPEAVRVAADNAHRNGVALDVRRWDWTASADELGRWPLVVAADVLYERRNAAPLLRALTALVADGGEAWIADPGRATAAGSSPRRPSDGTSARCPMTGRARSRCTALRQQVVDGARDVVERVLDRVERLVDRLLDLRRHGGRDRIHGLADFVDRPPDGVLDRRLGRRRSR